MGGWVYIMTNKPNGTLYVGVTNNLVRRVHEHRTKRVTGFSSRYDLVMLTYYERHATMLLAIQREKNIKHWVRQWKIELIESLNPTWADLWCDIAGQ